MNRTVIVTLATAALIGTTAGVGTALQQHGTDADQQRRASGSTPTPGGQPSASPRSGRTGGEGNGTSAPGPSEAAAPTPTAGGTGQSDALLYATADTIHDGGRSVSFDGPGDVPSDTPSALSRTADGYLVGYLMGQDVPSPYRLYTVGADGATTELGEVNGGWDVDESGSRIAGVDADTRRVTVWQDGDKVLQGSARIPTAAFPVFTDDAVLTSAQESTGWEMQRLDLTTGRTTPTRTGSFDLMSGSPDGTLLAGMLNPEGQQSDETGCLGGISFPAGAVEWGTCDWRVPDRGVGTSFSPDGSRVLGIPADTDGFGPGQFAMIDAREGARDVQVVDAPDWSLSASFADDDSLYVLGASDGNLDENTEGVISRCDTDGCEEVARTEVGAVLGTVR